MAKDEPVHFLDIARGIKGPICGLPLPWPRYDLLTIRADLVTCAGCLDQITKYLARARNAETLAEGGRPEESGARKDGPTASDRNVANPLDCDE